MKTAKSAKKNLAATPRRPQAVGRPLEGDIDRLLETGWPSLFNWPRFSELEQVQAPNVDVVDHEKDIVVRAEIAGFDKDDIEVSVTDNAITIKASSKSETEKERDGDYYLQEISRGYISRTLRLPSEVDGEKAKARYTDGVLEVTVPKIARAKRQRIEIQS